MNTTPTPSSDRLVWIDLEMSGLDVERERILEIAVLITDSDLKVVAEGPELVVHQPEDLLARMDAWNREHHGASGLVDQVRASTIGEREAEERVLEFVQTQCAQGTAPLAGNSVWNDRMFLRRYFPRLEAWLHYRIVDVSTVKELVRRWHPAVAARLPAKADKHRALDDIRESIAELEFYRREVLQRASPGKESDTVSITGRA
jgi:oligoribonuclease